MLHPRRRAHLGVAALATLAIAVAGCGGDDGAPTSDAAAQAKAPAQTTTAAKATTPAAEPAATTGTLSRKEYIRQADKVCLLARGLSHRANEVVQKAFNSGSADKAAQAIDNYLPAFMAHQRDLKALPRPTSGDRKILDGLLKVMDGQIQALADESKALRQQDSDAMAQIGEAQKQELQFAEELGRQYGFKVCGRA
jgi:hypothetical protein